MVRIAGLAMIISAVLTVVTIAFTAAGSSEKSPFERDEVVEYLTDINDNKETVVAGGVIGLINDGIFVLTIGAALYVLFRDRNPFLATMALAGVAAAAAISIVVDMSNILLAAIAKDFVEGGVGTIPAGDASSLELGRFVGMTTFAFVNALFMPAGLAFTSIGLLLVGAPAGQVNPPKWLGWVAIVAGLAMWLSLLILASEAAFIFFPINLLATTIFLVGLGVWLLRNGDLQPAPMRA
jgi:hypothetical protein